MFVFTTSGELDPANFNPITTLINSGTGTGSGTNLCLQNVTLANGDSFLTTVRGGIKDGLTASSLPGDGDFDFLATLYQPNSSCGTAYPTPSIIGPSNPATSLLSYTAK